MVDPSWYIVDVEEILKHAIPGEVCIEALSCNVCTQHTDPCRRSKGQCYHQAQAIHFPILHYNGLSLRLSCREEWLRGSSIEFSIQAASCTGSCHVFVWSLLSSASSHAMLSREAHTTSGRLCDALAAAHDPG
jgi:hypothetical protein